MRVRYRRSIEELYITYIHTRSRFMHEGQMAVKFGFLAIGSTNNPGFKLLYSPHHYRTPLSQFGCEIKNFLRIVVSLVSVQ